MSGGTVNVGVIGLGFMGATHLRAYAAAAAEGLPCRVVAVSDQSAERRAGGAAAGGNIGEAKQELLFDPASVRAYERAADLLADPGVSLVSICTPTDTHVDLALAAIKAGKYVLLEKPVALRSADVQRLADAARSAGTLCMPAMCMRFWPGWTLLRDAVRDGRWGSLRALTLHRLGSGPTWSQSFYQDVSRSGGALVDLHIHDTDFVVHLLGAPAAVRSGGGAMHITTLYDYPSMPGVAVCAEGSWSMNPGFGFRMQYRAAFERATVEFDLARSPTVTVFADGAASHPVLPAGTGYDGQVRHLIGAIAGGSRRLD
ncbi:MAG TPA: Gfo/Idh/MocA family oxidoreductase, partial [Phycisphaerales bacterium]|nr:Gfo/Idh/MocA family oxidoreductase [Phycisphaerales bacterium]